MIYKTLHRKSKIERCKPRHNKSRATSGRAGYTCAKVGTVGLVLLVR